MTVVSHRGQRCTAARLRRRSVRCPVCKKRFKVNARGRPPTFCSESCRQRAYEQRRCSRPHPVELLARDIDTARVRNVIRQEVREALLAANIRTFGGSIARRSDAVRRSNCGPRHEIVRRAVTGKVIGARCSPVTACKDHGPNTRLREHFRAKGADTRDAEFCRRSTFGAGAPSRFPATLAMPMFRPS
jgi:hypothetical protein